MSDFDGTVAVVTGAAKGIGKAVAEKLAGLGARVALLDVDEASAAREPVPGATFIRGDVGRSEDVERAVAEAARMNGRIDILVNSAGIQRYGSVVDTDEATWDEVLTVNLKSMYLTTRHAVPHMLAGDGGAIVNIASVQGLVTQRGVAAYAASKGGVIALTRALAVDFAPDVRANCICPGSVDTPMLREAADMFGEGNPQQRLDQWGTMHPIGRVGQPEEVAEAAAFLASRRASFITGAALLVDGGLLSILPGK